jgi:hypothetical protein
MKSKGVVGWFGGICEQFRVLVAEGCVREGVARRAMDGRWNDATDRPMIWVGVVAVGCRRRWGGVGCVVGVSR